MQLPQIRLQSTQAQIQLDIQPAKQSIEQPKAELDIKQPKAELNIERTPSKLMIDQTKAWEDMDLKHIFKRIEEFAQKGHNDWLEGVARRKQDGDELMQIENKSNPLAQQAQRNSQKPPMQFNIGWVPSHFSVKIDYQPTKLNIDWKVNKVENNTRVNKPILDYQPGQVTTSLKQRESLNIDFVNLKFVGINYEQSI